ncbi:MAG TPA: Sua5/YciO/YrdC/YwlC family protein, partial [Chitinophagaceae bacterium]|nr:Sua5/YciO/YrdC/YwlC family protein [Chitinophagaceae bacterium]
GCDIHHPKAIERICKIKNVDPKKVQLSFICRDLSHLSDYTKSIDTPYTACLKHIYPGLTLLFYRQVNKYLKF